MGQPIQRFGSPMSLYISGASATMCTAIAAFRARRCRLWGLGLPVLPKVSCIIR